MTSEAGVGFNLSIEVSQTLNVRSKYKIISRYLHIL